MLTFGETSCTAMYRQGPREDINQLVFTSTEGSVNEFALKTNGEFFTRNSTSIPF
jgi:hypothetical protein